MMTLEERLNKAEAIMQKPSFRQNKGLGNEVGYYIFDYPAEQEQVVRERVEYIRKKNEQSGDEYRIVVFDLYNIVIDILKDKGYMEKCYDFEKKKGFDRITKSIWQHAAHYSQGQSHCKLYQRAYSRESNCVSCWNRKVLSDPPVSYSAE